MNKHKDRSTWAIGGGIVAGVGAGLFVFPLSPLGVMDAISIARGQGLLITALLIRRSEG